jgi:hypothetical protein
MEPHFLEPDFWPGMTSELPVNRHERSRAVVLSVIAFQELDGTRGHADAHSSTYLLSEKRRDGQKEHILANIAA